MLPIKKMLFYLNVNLGECPSPQAPIMGFTASRSPLLPREWGWGDRGVSLPFRLSPSQLHPSKLTLHVHTACSVCVCVCVCVCARACTHTYVPPAHCREDSDGTSLHTVSSACLCHCTQLAVWMCVRAYPCTLQGGFQRNLASNSFIRLSLPLHFLLL